MIPNPDTKVFLVVGFEVLTAVIVKGRGAVWSDRSSMPFRGNAAPPSSGSKSTPSKRHLFEPRVENLLHMSAYKGV
jgi:hypothetical protein